MFWVVAVGKSYPIVVCCRVLSGKICRLYYFKGVKMDNILIVVGLPIKYEDGRIGTNGLYLWESVMPAKKDPNVSLFTGRFAKRLRYLREQAGLTAKEAARDCGVDENTIYAWEMGRNMPPVKKFPILAEIYGLSSVRELFPEK